MRSVYERLILLTEGWAGLPAIHQVRASVLVLATERFGAAALVDDARAPGIWQDAFVAEWRLDAVARHFPSDREIQLHRARGAFNALRAYGEGARAASDPASAERLWDRMAAAEERLDAVASAFPDDREIHLQRAMGAVNLMAAYGAGGGERLWDRMAAAEARLDAVASAFPDDREIHLRRAKGAFNALTDYGAGARAASDPASAERLWDRMAAAEERLDAVASAFPDDQEIRLWRAMGAVNLMAAYDAGAPRARDLRSGARNALAKAARDFPNDLKIQELASQIGVSFVQQLAGLRPPPRPE
jgi:hypothetical protein